MGGERRLHIMRVTKLKRSRRVYKIEDKKVIQKPVLDLSLPLYKDVSVWPPDRQGRKKGPKLKIFF